MKAVCNEQKDADRIAVSIVVPAYNEENAVAQQLTELRAVMRGLGISYEIIVVDDGSTDETASEIRRIDDVRVFTHNTNRGYGASLKTGISHANGDIIVITDADGTYPPSSIPPLLEAMTVGECDMAVGARTGEDVNMSSIRKPTKWLLRQLAAYLAGSTIPDLNSGLRAFKRSDALKLFPILPDGFSFTTTITLSMLTSGQDVRFIPINYHKRAGKSKIRPFRDTYNFLILIVRTISYFNPLKVFLPVAALLLLTGTVVGLYRAIAFHDIATAEILLIIGGLQIGFTGIVADMIASLRRLDRRERDAYQVANNGDAASFSDISEIKTGTGEAETIGRS